MTAIDIFRAIAVVNGAILIFVQLFLLVHKSATRRPGDRYFLLGILCFATFVVAQEAEQIGKPFIWWRLPLLVLGNFFFSFAVGKRYQHPHVPGA